MENDQTLFQNPNQPPVGLQQPQPQAQAVPPSVASSTLPPISFYQPEGKSKSFAKLKKILTILIGFLVVIGFIAIILFVALPNLSKTSLGGQVTLTYWGLWEDKKVMQGTISDFERENPNIKIDYSKQDIIQYRDRLLTRANNGTGPDIFRFHNTWYPMISSILLPLPSDTISKDEFL